MLCGLVRAVQMMQWKRSGGKEFVFFQSHPGFAFGNENVTKEFYDKIMCREMGDALHVVVERGQRWKCPTYREGAYSGRPHTQHPASKTPEFFKPLRTHVRRCDMLHDAMQRGRCCKHPIRDQCVAFNIF